MPAGLPTLSLCLLMIWIAVTAWQAWMPGGPRLGDRALSARRECYAQ